MSEQTYKEFANQHSELCAPTSWVEDNSFLGAFGITIPGKANLPEGVVKLLPQDFIVEEIAADGAPYTISTSQDALSPEAVAEGDTIFATLVKCNISTFEAVRQLTKQLGCTEEQVQYAGIKDQRAITAQRISFRKVPLERVRTVASSDFFLKDIVRGKGVLQPGQLWGNRFTILVRTNNALYETAAQTELTKALSRVAVEGFYNYFYLQRFSSPRYINFRWGRDMLLGNYEAAVRSVLTDVTVTEVQFFAEVRRALLALWGDWAAMLAYVEAQVPYDVFQAERAALVYLVDHPGDFLGVLKLDPRQTQMWVYAFGSKLFNEYVSRAAAAGAVPRELPTILSPDRNDTALYRKLFEAEGVWPPTWPSLRDFPHIQRRRQTTPTTIPVTFSSVDVVPEGIKLQFTLQKGGYATTFLSHLFNLRGGSLPATPGEYSFTDAAILPEGTRAYFAPVLAEAVHAELTDE
jgi:TruD family tRNA pseudouridine synthase